jgi:hypothetical protein
MLFRALKIKMADKHNCLTIFLILNFEHENALLNKGGAEGGGIVFDHAFHV